MTTRHGVPIRLAAALLVLSSPACRSIGPVAEVPGAAAAAEAPAPAPPGAVAEPPAAVRDALLPPLSLPPPGAAARRPEARFDVAVDDVPAREFFLGLVSDTPYDIVVHPAVSGSLSLSLRDATLPEILETVRQVYGYGYRPTPTGFHVLPADLQSRTFQVDYLDIQRLGLSQTRVSSGQLTEQYGEGADSTSPLGTTTTGRETALDVLENSQIRTESRADLWDELSQSLRAIVGEGEGRSVVVSPQAGIVVVRAMPDELREVEEYLSQARASLQRQVILDARILEVELSDGYRTGINWAALIESGSKSALFSQTGGGTFVDSGFSEIAGNTGNLAPGQLPSNTDTSAFGGVFSAALDLGDFSAFIELLETQGEVHVLSSPRVATVNNQKAVIKVGSDEFFVTDISTTTVTGTATTVSPQVTLTPFFSGIALDVLPQIGAAGDVILHVHPSVSVVEEDPKQIPLIGTEVELATFPLARSTVREADSIVRARSGQVVVIGGLMQERDIYRRGSLPWLGRIPWIGPTLFGQQLSDDRKSELVILLRPRMVEDSVWAQELRETDARLEARGIAPRAGRLFEDPVRAPGP